MASGVLPSIAIFVVDDIEVHQLQKTLGKKGRFRNEKIRVVDCSDGRNLSDVDTVRIFPLHLVKGMEFEVAFFYNIDKVMHSFLDRYLYVGSSRATFFLGITSSMDSNSSCRALEPMFDCDGDWSGLCF